MKRRDFLKIATGSAGGVAAIGAAGARSSPTSVAMQEEGNNTTSGNGTADNGTAGNDTAGNGTESQEGGGGEPQTKEVAVGPNGQNVFEPAEVYVKPGDTVKWVWEGPGHNVHATDVPEEASWDVQTEIADPPFEYEHTFEGPTGEYNYVCDPHVNLGMEGVVIVNESGEAPGGGEEGETELHPEEMGVPFQAHFVGIATVLMMIVSLVYTFFVLKYGESQHASAPNKE
ncbi:plastocyanin/azurin family copper-binding protein [Halobacterium wangiae]|uniref:plastocyanin/azurin family copper-binding protein n=1 Tax=Halobacterium wangiae TaxID=2902623 RepID=UPI001E4A1E39|nr:plastocyanin/azurin family copper-binding protein [Halobacterium wangiae]